MNKDYEDTVRIEHVALYGWLNAEHTTKLNKSKFEDLRIELIGPEYKAWQFGDERGLATLIYFWKGSCHFNLLSKKVLQL